MNILYQKNRYIISYDDLINSNKTNCNNNKILSRLLKNKLKEKTLNKLLHINENILKISKYNITLINSDFYLGFKLNRSKVYNYLLNECNLFCDYDPCIYQGVLVKYYWNENKEKQNGICKCTVPCNGKGTGNGNGECKKITISIFQSGNIIITGKTKRTEIKYIYDYIIELLLKNYTNIKQVLINKEPDKIKRRNISLLIQK